VSRNVAHFVVLPEYHPSESEHWSVGEARQFLAAAADHPLYPAYLLVLLYGLRRGEVLGIRWGDVDFEQGILHIRNKLQRVGRSLVQGAPKSNAGRRNLPLLAPVRQAFVNLRARYKEPTEEQLVFRKAGRPRDPDSVSVSFKRLAKRSGVKPIKLHEARHTAATILKDLGVPDRDIQGILGHANVTTTQQIYQHDSLESRQLALERLQNALLPSYKSNADDKIAVTGVSCRQLPSERGIKGSRSAIIFASPTSVRSWYTWQDSNLRPLAPQFGTFTLRERVAAVEQTLRVSRRSWLLGVVAVKTVVRY
jgi:hypothetical protein